MLWSRRWLQHFEASAVLIMCALMLIGLLLTGPAESVDAELLARVRAAHAAAAAALVPIELTYESRYANGTITPGEYFEDHKCIRTAEWRREAFLETRTSDGRSLTIYHNNKNAGVHAYWAPAFGNGKFQLLLHFYRQFDHGIIECAPVDVILSGPHQMHACAWDQVDGRKMVRLELTVSTLRYTWWLDPAVNFLVRRSTVDSPRNRRKAFKEVKEFKDLGDGVFMPMEAHFVPEGQSTPEVIIRVTGVRVGGPIAAEKFELTVPAEYRVWDSIAKKGFIVAPDGSWQDDRLPGRPTASGSAPTRPLPAPTDRPRPTQAESADWTMWLLSGAAGLVAAGLSLLAWRRLRGES